ncbi:CLUMA_CG005244, isoform A [Clunio marinus]|uniref:Polypeptide N-acetylgalactosaminyltransferase n=1 Tax=Clunio marinus TaxID=568069 RepID=A0A1J1HYH7_9DIPT|nr:CLUMA_CG005244, isoform A [Clunio marinus]
MNVIKAKILWSLRPFKLRKFKKIFFLKLFTLTLTALWFYVHLNDPLAIEKPFIFIEPITSYYRFQHNSGTKDWHDYSTIEMESQRMGPGEQGQPVYVTKDEEELSRKIFEENKHNGLVSDKIARDRSIPDTRPNECRTRQYLSQLPSVSVVIPFHNEILSTLTRTIHSIFTRSPPELLKEVILVNDHSDKDYCYGPLEEYIKDHFDSSKIRILVMPVRSGLMWARLAGARSATGDVLVFMDCHIEANVNWLPPLIEPIAKNYRTCTCPLIEGIDSQTYKYKKKGNGNRGGFNWQLHFMYLPLRSDDQKTADEPFETPVMIGCAFAISAKYFWELGGYDTGLNIWGGEQYELSFKVWLCGGVLLNVPCSRIGHLFRSRPFTEVDNITNYYDRNFKRVAEVWMDEYKHHIYSRNPDRWNKVDFGDLSKALELKSKLNCKPFKYFLEEIGPDIVDRYPPVEPPPFAYGKIQSEMAKELCIDTMNVRESELGLYPCKHSSKVHITQTFRLRKHRDISIEFSKSDCITKKKDKILSFPCYFNQNSQYFRYNITSKQIVCGPNRNRQCLDMNEDLKTIFIAQCDSDQISQRWIWDFVNETMLLNWVDYGNPISDLEERNELKNII